MHSVTVSSYVKSGLKANKAGRRDTVAEFSTVLPKSGRLTSMWAHIRVNTRPCVLPRQNLRHDIKA